MKSILYIGLAASLALGACSSTYKTAQTPDDVYYSPRQQQRTYASNNGSNGNSRQDENDANYVEGNQDEGGNYVTYQDDDQGDYQRRLNRFGSGSNYSGDYWDGYNAASNLYMSSAFGMGYGGFGMGYSPYSSFYGSSFGIGLGWGMGGFYSPWSSGFYGGFGYPYIGSYWPGYYYPYYGGGFYGHGGYYGGGGYYGHGGYYTTRPSNSYGPVRASNDRVPRNNYTNAGGTGGGGYTRPSRTGTFQPANGGNGSSGNDRPRRVFQQSSSERPVTRPTYQNNSGNSNNSNYSRPQRTEYSRPSTPAPSYTPSNSGGGRVGGGNSGGGGGGGYSRPSRGGR